MSVYFNLKHYFVIRLKPVKYMYTSMSVRFNADLICRPRLSLHIASVVFFIAFDVKSPYYCNEVCTKNLTKLPTVRITDVP